MNIKKNLIFKFSMMITFLSLFTTIVVPVYAQNNYNGDYGSGTALFAGTNNVRQNSVKLAVFAGCKTGEGDVNIGQAYNAKGTRHVITWTTTVLAGDHSKFLSHFNWAISNRYTLRNALLYAYDADTYNPNSGVTNVKIYTPNVDETISPSNSGNTATIPVNKDSPYTPKRINYIEEVNNQIILFEENDFVEIEKFLSNYDINFQMSNYEINANEIVPGGFLIELREKIGNFYTDSNYKIAVQDNVVTQITDNRINVTSKKRAELLEYSNNLKNITIDYYKTKVREDYQKSNISDYGSITEQEIVFNYDIKNDKKEILVYNTHLFEYDTMSVSVSSYEL